MIIFFLIPQKEDISKLMSILQSPKMDAILKQSALEQFSVLLQGIYVHTYNVHVHVHVHIQLINFDTKCYYKHL